MRFSPARFLPPLGLALALCLSTAGCGSSSVSVSAPSVAKCEVTTANSLGAVPAAGAAGTVTVTTTRDCTWAASSATAWVVITSSSNGQGSGSLSYRVAANPDAAARQGSLGINNSTVTIEQEAAPCRFTVTPASTSAAAEGGAINLRIEGGSGCGWTAVSQATWLRLGSAAGDGGATVVVTVDANDGAERRGALIVAGQEVTVVQAAAGTATATPPLPAPSPSPVPVPTPSPSPTPSPAPAPAPAPNPVVCSYAIQPAGQTMPASGGTGTITVTATASCGWTATDNASWLSIVSGASGTGNGTVTFRATSNNGGARSSTISVAGRTFTVSQSAAACNYSINPGSQSSGADASTASVAVSTGSACAWTASSGASWITVTSGASHTGNGTVALAIAANSGGARSATVNIAGQTFTVNQAAAPPPPCTSRLHRAQAPSVPAVAAGRWRSARAQGVPGRQPPTPPGSPSSAAVRGAAAARCRSPSRPTQGRHAVGR